MSVSKLSSLPELKDLSMDLIKGIPWAENMWENLQACLKQSFLNWVDIVLTMSQNEEDVTEWKTSYIELFEERCHEMVTDIKDLHEQVILNIEKYLNKTQVLCKKLQIDMPVIGQQKLGLYQEQFHLKKQLKELELMVQARTSELNQLRNKQIELCKRLGSAPKLISDHPLPSANEILDFHTHIEQLEQEIFIREEKFTTVKEELIQIIEELSYTPSNKFENDVINGNESHFGVTDENMQALDEFSSNMKKELKEVKEEISQLRNKIEHLWNILDIDFVERAEFRKKIVGHSLNTLETLRSELTRCENLKRINIKVFIDKLREELQQMWKQCHCSDTVRQEFRFFESDTYTEDLLELHEVQLKKWQIFYEENKETLNLLNKHRTLWDKMIELEQNATGPDRYNNRGGRLLKEEKERNLLSKQIPKIEDTLLNLAERYEIRHGVPFFTFGNTIEDYINNLHANRENAKKMKVNVRKQQKELTMLTPQPCTSVMGSKRQLAECTSSDVKKFKVTPRKVFTEPSKKKPRPLQIPKVLITAVNRSKRLSAERRKRIDKIRRLSKTKDRHNNSTYIEFENELSNRVDLRSTINLEAGCSKNECPIVAKSALKTPDNHFKTPLKMSSRTPKSSAKSPNTQARLTAAKSQIKLIF